MSIKSKVKSIRRVIKSGVKKVSTRIANDISGKKYLQSDAFKRYKKDHPSMAKKYR